MNISIFDLFSIGIGPSSSHTVGPMKAAREFILAVGKRDIVGSLARVRCDLYGSLAATGKGHGTDRALILGLQGESPDSVDVDKVEEMINKVRTEKILTLPGGRQVDFSPQDDLSFHRLEPLPLHPNGMHFQALDGNDAILVEEIYYSLGGGFIATEGELKNPLDTRTEARMPFPFQCSVELLGHAEAENCAISEIMRRNELARRTEVEINQNLDLIWKAMQECVVRGLSVEGTLPGGLKVERRARRLYHHLLSRGESALRDPLTILDWVNLYALAVNEENAAGGRVVTAPTNGAAGIIPAVLHYATRFCHASAPDGVRRFLLTAGAIASLYKTNASISGADVGCQGEVGVASSMAAGALVEYLGGSPQQVENAAEIGMEHNLGLTCDPIGGLVQIPCIERNAMGAVKAINAARMAMSGDGHHFVSLDKVIKTMWTTGKDMMDKYKETARGGLAVNVVEC